MKHVYLVIGETGEYDDHSEWVVRAYGSEELAQGHAAAAEAVAKEIFKEYPFPDCIVANAKNPHDPKMQIDYTGTRYKVEKVEYCGKRGSK